MGGPGASDSLGRRIAKGLAAGIARRAFSGRAYDLLLGRNPARDYTLLPEDPWGGNAAKADRIFQGRYEFLGREIYSPQGVPWDGKAHGSEANGNEVDGAKAEAEASEEWLAQLHGFDWLRHFRASGGITAQRHARALLQSWFAACGTWDELIWRPDVLARRLISWSRHASFLLDGADETFRRAFSLHFIRQSRHLARTRAITNDGAPRLVALIGQLHATLTLYRDDRRRLNDGLAALEAEIAVQVLADGGHASRSPAVLLGLLRDFIALRDLMDDRGIDCGNALRHAIDRMAPMLRFFRHGDGALALFHGANEESGAEIDLVLLKARAEGKPHLTAPHSGYQRAAPKRATLLFDIGLPASAAMNTQAHCSLLAFEFSYGRDRLVTSCGESQRGGEWSRALASSAAHSTLVIDTADNCRCDDDPSRIVYKREERDGHVWLEAEHAGYASAFNMLHRRRLFLSASGEDLRGEDVLTPTSGTVTAHPFAIRFHLHPDVQASLTRGGDGVLLRTGSQHGWRFRVSGASTTIDESVYFGGRGSLRRSRQIVLSGTLQPTTLSIKWALTRVIPE